MMDRIITKDEIPYDELDRMRAIRTRTGFNMSDEELKQFYVEWNNICFQLRGGKKNVKRI